MKTIITLFLISVSIASAQTNTNSAPIFISFTNTLGEYITNAEVVSRSANKLIYRTDGGLGGGTIRLDKLPSDLQARFNYDPTNAAKADDLDLKRKQRERIAGIEQGKRLQIMANREKMQKQATRIEGTIIQNLADGVLISCFSNPERSFYSDDIYDAWANKKLLGTLDEAENMIFLVDYPYKKRLAADDKIATVAYPDGFHKYTTVNHSENTVRRYTSSLDRAVVDWQPNAFNDEVIP